jgi:hypothetical protein
MHQRGVKPTTSAMTIAWSLSYCHMHKIGRTTRK